MNRQPVEVSVADFVVLLCVAVTAVAFFAMPWMRLLDSNLTGMQLIYAGQAFTGSSMSNDIFSETFLLRWSLISSSLWLVPMAIGISIIAMVLGLINTSIRQVTGVVICAAGGIALIPYAVLLILNISNPFIMAAVGPGFWMGLFAALGLVSHIFIPYLGTATFSVNAVSREAASERPQQPQIHLSDVRPGAASTGKTPPAPSPSPYPVITAIQKAGSFTGRRNRDWEPFIMSFTDLKIPDMAFCLVPAGSFIMGSDDGRDDEQPAHQQVITRPFWIARHPVTNAQWKLAVAAGAVPPPRGKEALKWYNDPAMEMAPVVGVSWFMAQAFAGWLGCRLPTEPEWEFAARGIESLRYPWGHDWRAEFAVWRENSGGSPASVTTLAAGMSWAGTLHMSGNVWEWLSSLYRPYPYTAAAERKTGIEGGRVVRGGSSANASNGLRASRRGGLNPGIEDRFIGLRCVRDFAG